MLVPRMSVKPTLVCFLRRRRAIIAWAEQQKSVLQRRPTRPEAPCRPQGMSVHQMLPEGCKNVYMGRTVTPAALAGGTLVLCLLSAAWAAPADEPRMIMHMQV